MAAPALKRRKISHSDMEMAPEGAQSSASSDIESQSSEEPTQHAPVERPNGTTTRPVRATPKQDEYSMYTGGLHKSHLFKLQVDTLVTQLQPNYGKRADSIDNALRVLKQSIERIEERQPVSVAEAGKLLHKSQKISIPYPDPKPDNDAAYKLHYAKPSKVNVVGSYVLKSMVKSDPVCPVDMIVTMPSSIFQEKDYLNYRYFYKRAYYLACIAVGLQEHLQDRFVFKYDTLNGNQLQPMIVATPKADQLNPPSFSTYEIHIILAAPKSFFSSNRLRPDRNSVRPSKTDGAANASTLFPSPFYNASLKSDCNHDDYLRLLHSASEMSHDFKDACFLGRLWLRQRGFNSRVTAGGFGHFEWATLTALLLNGGRPKGQSVISAGYTRDQMFKAVIQFLASSDLIPKPMVYESQDVQISKSSVPMLYDGPRGQNVLYKMKPWSYELLRDEARSSLAMLNDPTFEPFNSTFIARTNQALHRFDCIIQIPMPEKAVSVTSCDYNSLVSNFSTRLYNVMKEGLSDRVTLITILEPSTLSWSIKYSSPSTKGEQSLLVGIILDPANIGRLVDHGPSADDKAKASKFRRFWGEKAELRRFKDGSILESLVWSADSDYAVLQQIVKYLVARHVDPQTSEALTFIGGGFDELSHHSITDLNSFDTLRQAFQQLERTIRDFEGLPLRLRQISAIDPQLRYASIKAPNLSASLPMKAPAEILIQFEGSGRWPDDVAAIQRTKIAFLLKIGSLLQAANHSTTTRLGLENDEQPLQNCAFLDVLYPSGTTFRLRIHSDREQTLLERQIKDMTTKPRSRDQAVKALAAYRYMCLQLPRHTQSIATHCTRFPVLSPTIRLVKKWFDRHMLSRHIRPELIELLTIRTFLQPYPWQPPSSAMTGFLRTLLFISNWDWRFHPLIVDFSGSMTRAEVSSLQNRLEAWRQIDSGMNRTVLIAGCNHDMTGTAFTEHGPSKVVASRMTAIAISACKLVKEHRLDLDPKLLFATSMEEFDLVIKLDPEVSKIRKEKQNGFKNLQIQLQPNGDLVGYDPIDCFIAEIERVYTTSIVFFHGQQTDHSIAGLWNPYTAAPRTFKVNLPYATKPTAAATDSEDQNMVELNRSAILSEIARIGGDMISMIEVH